jgi:hypothetical protein
MSDKTMVITLIEEEQKLAEFIAKNRVKNNREKGAKATVYGDKEPWKAEVHSVGAELAFCKLFNCWPDLNTKRFGELDAVLKDGRTVDVKATELKSGRLLVKVKDREPCDLYALMIGDFPSYQFAGWMTGKELLQDERIDKKLEHPAFAAKPHELTDERKLNLLKAIEAAIKRY